MVEIDFAHQETFESVEAVLAHYGKLGMKWGKRKDRGPVAETPVEVQVMPGKRVQARGGAGQKPSQDAIDRAAARQRARQSTVDSLSTPELKKLVERMNLEANYAKLAFEEPTRLAKGKKFALKLISDEGMQLLRGKQGPVVGTVMGVRNGAYKGKHAKK